ncbi:hypothetical protein AB4142_32675, partial [Variovorax sp. 2RAF20]
PGGMGRPAASPEPQAAPGNGANGQKQQRPPFGSRRYNTGSLVCTGTAKTATAAWRQPLLQSIPHFAWNDARVEPCLRHGPEHHFWA